MLVVHFLNVLPADFYEAWTLVDNTQPLPIDLLSFKGECKTDKIDLTWSTASEINNALFNVYKSSNSIDFERVHSTPGALNSTQKNEYLFSDYDIIPQNKYMYRLEQVDIDGNSKIFDAIEVIPCKTKGFNALVYYNNGNVILQSNISTNYNLIVTIVNELGQIIESEHWNTKTNSTQLKIPAILSSGIYFVNIFNESVNETYKILVN